MSKPKREWDWLWWIGFSLIFAVLGALAEGTATEYVVNFPGPWR